MKKDHPNYNYFYGDKSPVRWISAILDNIFAIVLTGLIFGTIYSVIGEQANGVLLFLILSLVYLAYYIVMEAVWSRTLGKMICKLIVVDTDLKKISWKKSIIRNVARVLDANPLIGGIFIGGAFVLFSPRSQRIGDMLAGTVVQVYYKD